MIPIHSFIHSLQYCRWRKMKRITYRLILFFFSGEVKVPKLLCKFHANTDGVASKLPSRKWQRQRTLSSFGSASARLQRFLIIIMYSFLNKVDLFQLTVRPRSTYSGEFFQLEIGYPLGSSCPLLDDCTCWQSTEAFSKTYTFLLLYFFKKNASELNLL